MPIELSVPLEQTFELVESDKHYNEKGSSPTTVLIRQARQGEHERRASLFAQIVREQSINAPEEFVRFVQRFSFEELKRLEVFLTLNGSNIQGPDSKPLWKFPRSGRITEKDFNDGWAMLPVPIANEIHKYTLELNPDWDPARGEDF